MYPQTHPRTSASSQAQDLQKRCQDALLRKSNCSTMRVSEVPAPPGACSTEHVSQLLFSTKARKCLETSVKLHAAAAGGGGRLLVADRLLVSFSSGFLSLPRRVTRACVSGPHPSPLRP